MQIYPKGNLLQEYLIIKNGRKQVFAGYVASRKNDNLISVVVLVYSALKHGVHISLSYVTPQ
jgi:hypothetical protein